jgi:2'-hydroxyisoflavone reductase
MRLLMLGGTWFLGRAVVEEALRRGHEVTTFNRGISAPDVPGAQAVHGDRASPADLARLAASGGEWDAVVDTSGYVPAVVLLAARALDGLAGRYAFVSSVNAYQRWPVEPLTEASSVRECAPDDAGEGTDSGADRYGRPKAGCENAVTSVFADRALLLRPGVILGPGESVGRVAWWLRRMARGGQVPAPGYLGRPIQPVDVRDVAAFTLDALGGGLAGAVNVAAPVGHSTFGEFLGSCATAAGPEASLT